MEAYDKVSNIKLYQAFRSEGYPTLYDENQTSARIDLEISEIIYIFAAIAVSVLIILPGFRGKERLYVSIRSGIGLLIGLFILLCNFDYYWESDDINVHTQYKAGLNDHINATIGLHIGLRGINITLKGIPEHQIGETIYYNEHFSWQWNQGRDGFGPQAGQFHQEFRSAQHRGLPYPILWIAEYFVFDGEGIRFGRHYRIAGWYAHIMIWLSVPLFILSNILFQMVIQYGAVFLLLTGLSLLSANILFSNIRNAIALKIPFEHYPSGESVFLSPHYSWCFYLNLLNGLFCATLGIIAFFADLRYPDETAEFFGIDVLQSYEDYYADFNDSLICNVKTKKGQKTKDVDNEMNGDQIYAGLKKRTLTDRLSRLQKSTIRKKPITQPRHNTFVDHQNKMSSIKPNNDLPLYENFKLFESIGEETE